MRSFLILSAASLALLVCGCASAYDTDAEEAARAACQSENPGATPAVLEACERQMEANIQAARTYRRDAPQRPPPGSQPRGGGRPGHS